METETSEFTSCPGRITRDTSSAPGSLVMFTETADRKDAPRAWTPANESAGGKPDHEKTSKHPNCFSFELVHPDTVLEYFAIKN